MAVRVAAALGLVGVALAVVLVGLLHDRARHAHLGGQCVEMYLRGVSPRPNPADVHLGVSAR
jgi:hypothetical protein